MKKDNKIKIIKVPLKNKSKDVYPNFPSMPILYLELLENNELLPYKTSENDFFEVYF
jgi:hypothetical protein